MKVTRILCPVDFSDASRQAIDEAVVVAGFYKSRISALHVLAPLTLAMTGVATTGEDVSELDRLRRLTGHEFAAATARNIAVDVLVDVGQPAGVIVERASSRFFRCLAGGAAVGIVAGPGIGSDAHAAPRARMAVGRTAAAQGRGAALRARLCLG